MRSHAVNQGKSEVSDSSSSYLEGDHLYPEVKPPVLSPSILIKSTLANPNPIEQMTNVVSAFNKGNTESFVRINYVFGNPVPFDHFRLIHRNNVPELLPPNNKPQWLFNLLPWIPSGEIGTYKQTTLHIGALGRHYINVPQGKYVKAWIGISPILLEPGPHVIIAQNFKLDADNARAEESALVDIASEYIKHGNYHRIRIPAGKIAKIWEGTTPRILESRTEPYEFNDPLFRLEPTIINGQTENFEDTASQYIHHGNYHRLRIPAGKLAKIWIGNTPKILESRDEPYEFNDPLFRLEPKVTYLENGLTRIENYEDTNSEYIQHGNYHRLRVPAGKIAKVWEGNKAKLLPSRDEPYIYENNPLFKLDKKITRTNNQTTIENFENSTELLIVHGSIKKVMPRTGEVAICYKNGELETRKDAFEIDDPTFKVDGFLAINTQTLVFPEKGKDFIEFRTSDSLKIGVKLLVIYDIEDPKITLTRLNKDDIKRHIENIIIAEMGRAIGNSSSADFQNCNQSPVTDTDKKDLLDFYHKFQIPVEEKLKKSFAEYGIKLERLNIETPQITDPRIADQMATYSLDNAKSRAEIFSLTQKMQISSQEAKRKAAQSEIDIEQANKNQVSKAEADKTAKVTNAEAAKEIKRIEAEAMKNAMILEAEGQLEAAKKHAEAIKAEREAELAMLQKEADILKANPQLVEIRKAKIYADAISKNNTIISTDVAQALMTNGFFASRIPPLALTAQVSEEKKESVQLRA